jgi:uncharacterized protein (DUF362 family)
MMKSVPLTRRRFLGSASAAVLGGIFARQLMVAPNVMADEDTDRMPEPLPSYQVGIARGAQDAAKDTTFRAIHLAGGFFDAVAGARRVLIKPNLTVPSPPGGAICTDVGVVEAVVELLWAAGVSEIVVADGSGDDPERKNFEVSGYDVAMARLGVQVVDLNYEPTRTVPVPRGLAYEALDIPEIVLDADAIIDVAKLKTHTEGLVTLGAKNLFGGPPVFRYNLGAIARQEFHQKGIHKVIHDINTIVPIAYTVIDGVLAMEGNGPIRGTPVEAGLVIAGANLVATDATGCYVMQIDPHEVGHLVNLHQSGYGPLDLGAIQVVGECLEDVSRPFQQPGQAAGNPPA